MARGARFRGPLRPMARKEGVGDELARKAAATAGGPPEASEDRISKKFLQRLSHPHGPGLPVGDSAIVRGEHATPD